MTHVNNNRAFLFTVLTLTCFVTPQALLASDYVYPSSSFVEERQVDLLTSIHSLFGSNEQLRVSLAKTMDHDELVITLNDPFVTNIYTEVVFTSRDTGQDIARYYERLLQGEGWTLERERLSVEDSGIEGTDWGRSYHKNEQLILLKVSGHWLKRPETTPDNTARFISIGFIGIGAKDVLGTDYKKKKTQHAPPEGRGEAPRP